MKPSRCAWIFWLWFLLLLILNIVPTKDTILDPDAKVNAGFRVDYLAHFLAFLVPALIYRYVSRFNGFLFKNNQLLNAFAVSGTCAISFEYLQRFLPHRTFNLYDLFYNLVGVVFGFLVVSVIEVSKTRYRHRPISNDIGSI